MSNAWWPVDDHVRAYVDKLLDECPELAPATEAVVEFHFTKEAPKHNSRDAYAATRVVANRASYLTLGSLTQAALAPSTDQDPDTAGRPTPFYTIEIHYEAWQQPPLDVDLEQWRDYLLYHELAHIRRDGKTRTHHFETTYGEIRRYYAWHPAFEHLRHAVNDSTPP